MQEIYRVEMKKELEKCVKRCRVTMVIKSGGKLASSVSLLMAELSHNRIRQPSVRRQLCDTYEYMINEIKLMSRVPDNGLVIYAGYDREKDEYVAFHYVPTEPVTRSMLISDTIFHYTYCDGLKEEIEEDCELKRTDSIAKEDAQ
jgi:peptide subunit release factor 1 (eRF1)